jgi:hypothetical protein
LRSAELRAVALIEEHGWEPLRFDSWELVTRETYANRASRGEEVAELQESVEQAFAEGRACAFFIWPVDDAPDAPDT